MTRPNTPNERCRRFCGDSPEPCFAGRARQVRCIADMVLNKVGGVQAALAIARRDSSDGVAIDETLSLADDALVALVEWVRYLQVADDKDELSRLAAPRDVRRREERFVVPLQRRALIHMEVATDDGRVPVVLEDFSHTGLQFSGDIHLKVRRRYPAVIVLRTQPPHTLTFEVQIRHRKGDVTPTYGASVKGAGEQDGFSIFVLVYEFLVAQVHAEDPGPTATVA